MNRLAVQTERNAPDTRITRNHSYTPERAASAGPLPIDRGAPALHETLHATHLSGGWDRQGYSMARWPGTEDARRQGYSMAHWSCGGRPSLKRGRTR